MQVPNILTIAGSDSGGGAGIQADIKTFMALGAYGMTVITALTAQNGTEVRGIFAPPPEFVLAQYEAVYAGFPVAAAKTGMLYSAEIMAILAPRLRQRNFPLVVDPVSVSQSGHKLLEDSAVCALRDLIIPGCDLLTPNLPEAAMLTGINITEEQKLKEAGAKLLDMGAKAVLIKGGHDSAGIMVTDWLFQPGESAIPMRQARVETGNNHGTGCTLSAAIATGLGKGLPLKVAISQAQQYLNLALRKSWAPGTGSGPVNHAANLANIN